MPRPSRYAPDNLPRPPHWAEHAVCRGDDMDPELWFPDDGDLLAIEEAKGYCHTCPVQHPCAESALERGEPHGIFGGLSAEERRAVRSSGGGPHAQAEAA